MSPATVSRVLNNTGRVKETTRSRVLKVVEAVGYQHTAYVLKDVVRPTLGHPGEPSSTMAHDLAHDVCHVAGSLVVRSNRRWNACDLFPGCPRETDEAFSEITRAGQSVVSGADNTNSLFLRHIWRDIVLL